MPRIQQRMFIGEICAVLHLRTHACPPPLCYAGSATPRGIYLHQFLQMQTSVHSVRNMRVRAAAAITTRQSSQAAQAARRTQRRCTRATRTTSVHSFATSRQPVSASFRDRSAASHATLFWARRTTASTRFRYARACVTRGSPLARTTTLARPIGRRGQSRRPMVSLSGTTAQRTPAGRIARSTATLRVSVPTCGRPSTTSRPATPHGKDRSRILWWRRHREPRRDVSRCKLYFSQPPMPLQLQPRLDGPKPELRQQRYFNEREVGRRVRYRPRCAARRSDGLPAVPLAKGGGARSADTRSGGTVVITAGIS